MDKPAVQSAEASEAGPRYQPLVLVATAACAGIVLDRCAAWPVAWWWAAATAAWAVWWGLWRLRWDRAAAIAVLVSAAACGGAWHHCRWSLFDADDLGSYARRSEQPICVEAVALGGPRRQFAPPHDPMRILPLGDRTRMEVEIVAVRNGSDWQAAAGRSRLVIDGHLLGARAGDRLRVFAQLARLYGPDNPGMFDYAAHARADRMESLLRAEHPDCVSILRPGSVLSPRRAIDAVRRTGDRFLWQQLDPRRAGLASAVLLGCREEVTTEQTEAFVQTGTVHILSISGMHVGILAALVFLLMRLLPAPRGVIAGTVAGAIVFYTVLADAEPPAVRAMVLVLVMCGAFWLGRKALAMNSLAAAALIVLALNPADLFRIGTQLSFLCMIGMMWVNSMSSPRDATRALQEHIEASRPWPIRAIRSAGRWAWDLTLVGGVIWSLTLPLVMARFHILSPVALVLNTLMWLPMTAALWCGMGVLALGLVFPGAAPVFGWCCDRSLAVLEWGIETARRVPGSYFWVPGPAEWWLAGFYGGVGLLLAFPRLRPPRRWSAALAAGWVAVGLAVPLVAREKPNLSCTFLSVGHGCAAVVHLPSGKTMLYDAGAFSSPERATHAISSYLWSQGIRHVDAVLLSHADADHYNGVPGLLERFSVGVAYVSPVMFENRSPALNALDNSLRRKGVPVREIFAGDLLSGGEGCRIEVLHPPRRGALGGDNANSVVLAIEYQGRRVLLPGDLDPAGLNGLLDEEPWHCDVLLAPHHGSRRSDPPGLAQWSSPQIVVVSGGLGFDVRQTTATYRKLGAEVLHTGEVGAIQVRIDQEGLQVATGATIR